MSYSHINTQKQLLLNNLMEFYNNKENLNKMMNVINGESKISLRIVDGFVTNYAKKYYTVYEIPKITYNEFLKELKAACAAIGLNPTLFATHSLRRARVSDQFANGVPDKVIKYSGRWRSNAFEAYIDHTVLFELQLKTIQPPE